MKDINLQLLRGVKPTFYPEKIIASYMDGKIDASLPEGVKDIESHIKVLSQVYPFKRQKHTWFYTMLG